MNRRRALLRLAAAAGLGLPAAGQALQASRLPAPEPDEIWLLLNTDAQRLEVFLGEQPVLYYNNVSWGRGGVGIKRRQGDEVTPVGSFRIAWVNRDSRYRTFWGFDYPTIDYANRALEGGTISRGEFSKIVDAVAAADIPPQSTAIGGSLGIHGLGKANADIHRSMHWTSGCIALNNTQIDHLSRVIEIGTRVEVRR